MGFILDRPLSEIKQLRISDAIKNPEFSRNGFPRCPICDFRGKKTFFNGKRPMMQLRQHMRDFRKRDGQKRHKRFFEFMKMLRGERYDEATLTACGTRENSSPVGGSAPQQTRRPPPALSSGYVSRLPPLYNESKDIPPPSPPRPQSQVVTRAKIEPVVPKIEVRKCRICMSPIASHRQSAVQCLRCILRSMQTWKCNGCHAENDRDANRCIVCGIHRIGFMATPGPDAPSPAPQRDESTDKDIVARVASIIDNLVAEGLSADRNALTRRVINMSRRIPGGASIAMRLLQRRVSESKGQVLTKRNADSKKSAELISTHSPPQRTPAAPARAATIAGTKRQRPTQASSRPIAHVQGAAPRQRRRILIPRK